MKEHRVGEQPLCPSAPRNAGGGGVRHRRGDGRSASPHTLHRAAAGDGRTFGARAARGAGRGLPLRRALRRSRLRPLRRAGLSPRHAHRTDSARRIKRAAALYAARGVSLVAAGRQGRLPALPAGRLTVSRTVRRDAARCLPRSGAGDAAECRLRRRGVVPSHVPPDTKAAVNHGGLRSSNCLPSLPRV
jgi:hypothetical protein